MLGNLFVDANAVHAAGMPSSQRLTATSSRHGLFAEATDVAANLLGLWNQSNGQEGQVRKGLHLGDHPSTVNSPSFWLADHGDIRRHSVASGLLNFTPQAYQRLTSPLFLSSFALALSLVLFTWLWLHVSSKEKERRFRPWTWSWRISEQVSKIV